MSRQDCFDNIQVGDVVVWDGAHFHVLNVVSEPSSKYGPYVGVYSTKYGRLNLDRGNIGDITKIIKAPR